MTERERETEAAVGHGSEYGGVGHPEEDQRIHGEQHPVARMIAIGVIAALIGIGITLLIDWFPEDGDTAASQIDTVYDVLLICSVPVFVLVMTVAIYSVVRFRAKPGDMGDGPPIPRTWAEKDPAATIAPLASRSLCSSTKALFGLMFMSRAMCSAATP